MCTYMSFFFFLLLHVAYCNLLVIQNPSSMNHFFCISREEEEEKTEKFSNDTNFAIIESNLRLERWHRTAEKKLFIDSIENDFVFLNKFENRDSLPLFVQMFSNDGIYLCYSTNTITMFFRK